MRSEIETAGFSGIVFRTLKIQCKGRVKKPPCRYFAMLPDGPAPAYKFRLFRVDSEWKQIIEELGEDSNSDKTKFGENVTSVTVPVTSACSVKDLMGGLYWADRLWGMDAAMTCSRRLVEFLYNHKFRGISASILQFFRRETRELSEMTWPPESWCRGYEKEILETGGLRLL